MTRLRLTAIALPLLISTSAWADLRTFDIEPQYQQEVFAALSQVLTLGPEGGMMMGSYGRVELLPSGQILVNAPPETLEQVQQVLQAIRTRSVAAAPRVSLRYWAVLGARAQSDATAQPSAQVTVTVVGPDAVGSLPPVFLNGVLSELERVHGDLTFRVIGTAAVATNSGQFGEIQGTALSVEQTAHVQGDTLNAEISMELSSGAGLPIGQSTRIGNLNLRTTLERGEFVVLGESLVQHGPPSYRYDGPVFYIVHWEK